MTFSNSARFVKGPLFIGVNSQGYRFIANKKSRLITSFDISRHNIKDKAAIIFLVTSIDCVALNLRFQISYSTQ